MSTYDEVKAAFTSVVETKGVPAAKKLLRKWKVKQLADLEEDDYDTALAAMNGTRALKKNGRPVQLMDFDVKGIFLTVHQFHQETGKDRASIEKKLRLGLLKPVAGPGGNACYRLRDLIDLVFYRDDTGRVDIDRLDPFRRKAHYSAEIDKLRMLRESGQLIPVAQVEAEQARIAKVLTHFLETLPDILERDCGAGATMLAKIEQRIDAAREDLYKAVIEKEPVDETEEALPDTGGSTVDMQPSAEPDHEHAATDDGGAASSGKKARKKSVRRKRARSRSS